MRPIGKEMNPTEPRTFIQGETVRWRKEFDCYASSGGYSIIYYLRGQSGGIDIGGADDDGGFIFTITSSQSANLATGNYSYQAFAIKNADKFLVSEGTLQIKAGLSTIAQNAAFDNRTQAEKDLAAVREMISGKASKDVQRYTINNRQLDKIPIPDLIALETRLVERVRQEKRAARLKKGGKFFKTILVRMKDD